MDANRARIEYRWTNERHLRFLKSVEASFVRTMLENGDGRLIPMDRNVPDCCESTSASTAAIGTNRRKRHFPSSDKNLDSSKGIDRRVKRLRLHQSSLLSQNDQVVPQIENIKNDEDGGDKNWRIWT